MEPSLSIYAYELTAKPSERLPALDGVIREYDDYDPLTCDWLHLEVEFEWVKNLKRLNIYVSSWINTSLKEKFHAYMEKSTNGWEYHGPMASREMLGYISRAATEELERRRL